MSAVANFRLFANYRACELLQFLAARNYEGDDLPNWELHLFPPKADALDLIIECEG
jgi:hypothetical protein